MAPEVRLDRMRPAAVDAAMARAPVAGVAITTFETTIELS